MTIVTQSAAWLNQKIVNWAAQNAAKEFQANAQQIARKQKKANVLEKICLEVGSWKSDGQTAYALGADVVNAKTYIFNACTVALIASGLLWMRRSLPSAGALVLGACFYFGRKVADESFNMGLPREIIELKPDILKPRVWLSFSEIVLFYATIPRKL